MGNKQPGGVAVELTRDEARELLQKFSKENRLGAQERSVEFVLDHIDTNKDNKYQKKELLSDKALCILKAAVRASENGFMNMPGASRLATHDRSSWTTGDVIEVWSKSRNRWYDDGVIVESEVPDYSKLSQNPAFYIKVRYAFCAGWVWDLNTSERFRASARVPPASLVDPIPMTRTSVTLSVAGSLKLGQGDKTNRPKRSLGIPGTSIPKLIVHNISANPIGHDTAVSHESIGTETDNIARDEEGKETKDKIDEDKKKDDEQVQILEIEGAIKVLEETLAKAKDEEHYQSAARLKDQRDRMREQLKRANDDIKERKAATSALQEKIEALYLEETKAAEANDYKKAAKMQKEIGILRKKIENIRKQASGSLRRIRSIRSRSPKIRQRRGNVNQGSGARR